MARGAAEAAQWLAVPIGLVFWVTVFWLGGRWIDGRFNTEPWAQLVGTVVGCAVGFVYVFWAVRVAMSRSNGSGNTGGDHR